jgi:hypothetical protein
MDAGFTAFEAECLKKIFVEEKSVTQAARELQRSPGNVSDAVERARKRCANPDALQIPIGRRKSEFKKRFPTPFSQLGKAGLNIDLAA